MTVDWCVDWYAVFRGPGGSFQGAGGTPEKALADARKQARAQQEFIRAAIDYQPTSDLLPGRADEPPDFTVDDDFGSLPPA